jgi:hypothetical protein
MKRAFCVALIAAALAACAGCNGGGDTPASTLFPYSGGLTGTNGLPVPEPSWTNMPPGVTNTVAFPTNGVPNE